MSLPSFTAQYMFIYPYSTHTPPLTSLTRNYLISRCFGIDAEVVQTPGSVVASGHKVAAEEAGKVYQTSGAANQPVCGFAAEETGAIRSARAAIQRVRDLAAEEPEVVHWSAPAAIQPVLRFVPEKAGRALQ